MRRFYKEVSVREDDGLFAVQLDGRSVKTPSGAPLRLPSRALAGAIAREWHSQDEEVRPASMPLTQLASTVLDRFPAARAAVVDHLMGYAGADLLCYRASGPADLVRRQEQIWQPLIDWVETLIGARMSVTTGVIPVPQPADALDALCRRLDGLDDWHLAALQVAVTATGSLILGLALLERRLSAEEAFAASQLDETYQNELWGEDAEAVKSRTVRHNDITSIGAFLELSES
ncbi:MAG: ATPase [Telmatospirillum sp.]|nr:ATPase [Telmatospirillum sp.]